MNTRYESNIGLWVQVELRMMVNVSDKPMPLGELLTNPDMWAERICIIQGTLTGDTGGPLHPPKEAKITVVNGACVFTIPYDSIILMSVKSKGKPEGTTPRLGLPLVGV